MVQICIKLIETYFFVNFTDNLWKSIRTLYVGTIFSSVLFIWFKKIVQKKRSLSQVEKYLTRLHSTCLQKIIPRATGSYFISLYLAIEVCEVHFSSMGAVFTKKLFWSSENLQITFFLLLTVKLLEIFSVWQASVAWCGWN